MLNLPFFIITSDATKEILPATCYLYNKYWHQKENQNFKFLGNHAPDNDLPNNFSFVNIKDENNIQKWTWYIYNYIKNNESSEYFIFGLDDYLPNAYLKPDILEKLLNYAKQNPKVGRISLAHLDVEKWDIAEHFDNFDIVKLKRESLYRLSCQISVWHRDYFFEYFKHEWTPWQLELEGSRLAHTDDYDIIGTNRDWAFGWVEESALSGRWPGKINVLGLQMEDIKYFVESGIFNPERVQYGIWYDCKIPFISRFQSISKKLTKIPQYKDIGLNFNWSLVKPFVRAKTFNRLLFRYKSLYPEK
jgi:hypothetical protein